MKIFYFFKKKGFPSTVAHLHYNRLAGNFEDSFSCSHVTMAKPSKVVFTTVEPGLPLSTQSTIALQSPPFSRQSTIALEKDRYHVLSHREKYA